jgi:hypothetical protein
LTIGLPPDTLKQMPVKSIQLGQVWRNDETGGTFLVTKLYSEVFSEYAVLREVESGIAGSQTVRVKVVKNSAGVALPGYSFTQDTGF